MTVDVVYSCEWQSARSTAVADPTAVHFFRISGQPAPDEHRQPRAASPSASSTAAAAQRFVHIIFQHRRRRQRSESVRRLAEEFRILATGWKQLLPSVVLPGGPGLRRTRRSSSGKRLPRYRSISAEHGNRRIQRGDGVLSGPSLLGAALFLPVC